MCNKNTNILGPVAKGKWKDLVDTFHKKDKSGSAGKTIAEQNQKWKFYETMLFIRPFIAHHQYDPLYLFVLVGFGWYYLDFSVTSCIWLALVVFGWY